jgi:tripartite ATP-independent transporter DctM subunit
MLLATILTFLVLMALSMPIVFSLGFAAVMGLLVSGYPLQTLASTAIGSSQSWVLLAVPSFIFAGLLMERCGLSNALVELARALVGWLRGGLGMSVIMTSYFFSDICGSIMAEVSTISTTMISPLRRAGYRAEHAASLIASGCAMGMLVPPCIFMIVLANITNTSAVALFLAGFLPAALIAFCLCVVVYIQAHILGWPKDTRPSWRGLLQAVQNSAVSLVILFVLIFGFYFGVFTTTEAGAVVAIYSILIARFWYRNVSWREIFEIACDTGILTAAVIFLIAIASTFQYILGVAGASKVVANLFTPLQSMPWLFLIVMAIITMFLGMILEGLPASVILVPVIFPIATKMGIHPIHFNIVQTTAVGIGLFLPPLGIGLLVALRFAKVPVFQHARYYWPYVTALLVGLLVIIFVPEISLVLPRGAGLIR